MLHASEELEELRRELEVTSLFARESGCAQREQVLSSLVTRAMSLLRYVAVQLDSALSADERHQYEMLRDLKANVSKQPDRIEREYARVLGRARAPPEEP